MNALDRSFLKFHKENPHIYKLFCKYSLEAIASGQKVYSARGIVFRIRWFTDVETRSSEPFKINDHHSPYWARMFMRDWPQHDEFFRTRLATADFSALPVE